MKIELKKRKIDNITELGIGDVVCAGDGFPMTVVGLWADYSDYSAHIPDHTGEVICDFDENAGDVFEYNMSDTDIYLVENAADLVLNEWQHSNDIIEDLDIKLPEA